MWTSRRLANFLLLFSALIVVGQPGRSGAEVDTDALPDVEEGLAINIFVREPQIINPSSLCFDNKGRLFVGAGPQYRSPREDSPTDYIKILIDQDDDGVAEEVKTFAEGFNSIQGLAWRNNELWVANAPELTVLRDTDGDDVADEYQIIFSGLNNLRHGLHGLNWGPDGWLYMSLGNTWVSKDAPKAIRDLQGITSDTNPQYPLTKIYSREDYPKGYHPLNKDEKEGGIFRCRARGHGLELYARGMRNPWDICMDTGFNWLGTDNDPGRPGERMFMPVPFAHYSMRHAWMFDWMGEHPAVAPASDLFPGVSGSGTGVTFYHSNHFPEAYQNRYLIADWTNNCIFLYEPKWEGSLQVPAVEKRKIVDGGTTQGGDLGYKGAKGRALFRPTDIEVGPDGALYIAGWGSVYGTDYVPKEEWTEEENAKYHGRVFRLTHSILPLISRELWDSPKRAIDITEWNFEELLADLGHQLAVWRVNAQDEVVRRGQAIRPKVLSALTSGNLSEGQETWAAWALGRMDQGRSHHDIVAIARNSTEHSVNLRVQALRILGENRPRGAISVLEEFLRDAEPRLRLAAVQSLGRTGLGGKRSAILNMLAEETDRLTFYTGWQVMRRHVPAETRRKMLKDSKPGIRRMALLSLLEEGAASAADVLRLLDDDDLSGPTDRRYVAAKRRIPRNDDRNIRNREKLSGAHHGIDLRRERSCEHPLYPGRLLPEADSDLYAAPLTIESDTTLKAAAFDNDHRISKTESLTLHRITDTEWKNRLFIHQLQVQEGKGTAHVVDQGLQPGVTAYCGPSSPTLTVVPKIMTGSTMIQTDPNDSTRSDENYLSFHLNLPATVFVAFDTQGSTPDWIHESFTESQLHIETSDSKRFRIYSKEAEKGEVVLGGNAPPAAETSASMFQVYVSRSSDQKTSAFLSMAALSNSNLKHGEELFFGRGTCFACHQVKGRGTHVGPDLVDISRRRDAAYVIKSILDPDDYIVEGFQQTSLLLSDGRKLFGMIQEETAQSLQLFLLTGEPLEIDVDHIELREDAENSGMPSSYSHTLSPQDVADLTAWIMTLKSPDGDQ